MRGIGAVALTLTFSSGALAERGVMHRVSCAMVRVYVAKYSASAAEMWARSHGATDAQIEAAQGLAVEHPIVDDVERQACELLQQGLVLRCRRLRGDRRQSNGQPGEYEDE